MKRLDLSCLPLNLEVGETMELIDKCGKYHLLQCVPSEKGSSRDGCFFADAEAPLSCDHVMCSSLERFNERDDVIYIELPVKDEFREEKNNMKKLYFDTLAETGKIKAGETFIYVDCLDVQHKVIAKKVETLGDCRSCVFDNDACCLVNCARSGRESKDDVYFMEQTKTQ